MSLGGIVRVLRKAACIAMLSLTLTWCVIVSTCVLLLVLSVQLDPTLSAAMLLVRRLWVCGSEVVSRVLVEVLCAVCMAEMTLLLVCVTLLQSVFLSCRLNLCVWLLVKMRRAR